MIKNAHELQEFINSVRKKALEDVIKVIKSESVRKDEAGFIMMYDCELIELINAIDTVRLKKERAEAHE